MLVLVLFCYWYWNCVGTGIVLVWYGICIGIVLVWYCIATAMVMVLVWYWYSIGMCVVLFKFWYCMLRYGWFYKRFYINNNIWIQCPLVCVRVWFVINNIYCYDSNWHYIPAKKVTYFHSEHATGSHGDLHNKRPADIPRI